MSKAKKIGLGLVVLGMLVAVPVVAAEVDQQGNNNNKPVSTESASQNRGGSNSTIFDIFTMSPEQFVNAMNSNAND